MKMKIPFKKIQLIWFALAIFLASVVGYAEVPRIKLTPEKLACLEKLIYFNECSGRPERLVSWRADEKFPSLGIGHFIWYPQDIKGPFQESFPQFLQFVEKKEIEIPSWLKALPGFSCPWKEREEFQKELKSENTNTLRNFLEKTKDLQTLFIVQRLEEAFPKILEIVPQDQHHLIEKKLALIESTPNGVFALIDYVNFKGEGILEAERFKGRGWGLLQVLEEMKMPKSDPEVLPEFVRAAQTVLEKRVQNSAISEEELKRLQGWKNRVLRYLSISC